MSKDPFGPRARDVATGQPVPASMLPNAADLLRNPEKIPAFPAVAQQLGEPSSTLERVRRLLAVRRTTPELRTTAATTVLTAGYPFVYRRGERHLVVVNPSGTVRELTLPELRGLTARPLEADGVVLADGGTVTVAPFGYGVFEIVRAGGLVV